jgi:hypothetical protein
MSQRWYRSRVVKRGIRANVETCSSKSVTPSHVRRGYMPGKWIPLSGLTIEVAACAVLPS